MLALASRPVFRACVPNARRSLSVRVLNEAKAPAPGGKRAKAVQKEEPSKAKAKGSAPKKEEKGPKKAPSAYNLFFKAKFPEIKKAKPDVSLVDGAALVREAWAAATPEAKVPFQREAAELKAAVAVKRAEFKAAKKANARPLSGYMLFSNKERAAVKAANPDKSMIEISALLGKAWKELPEAEKEKYKAESQKLKDEWKAKQAPSS
ncbi:hypothetical protein Agub_g14431 [Astrephomene gubernaculifera]|uniref:HMG box domain-containing protein n=1 Tax=Astrephomene gubernaculifera TaxID=47775 RepID=A0AAD3HSZ1_9CHLO|nr:hypothetical protein Agub_g14431 [Astrephomene gubernaculifera]